MKVKLKNTGAAARFFLSHGEKLGMAAVVACAGLLIWSSMGRERLEPAKQPAQLQQQAQTASTHVEEQTWDNFDPTERIVAATYVSATPTADVPAVRPDAFPKIGEFDPPVVEPAALRKDPPLLAPEAPEARGGSGLWAWAAPNVIKQKMREAAAEAQKQEKEEEKRRAEEEADGGGGRGGYGGYGGGGRGGYGGGGRGGYGGGGGDFSVSKDGVVVLRPTGGAETQGFEQIDLKSWVTIVAKVPVKKQFAEYRETLAKSHGYSPMTDMPTYLGYEVERAEVTEERGDPQWKQVGRISAKQLLAEMANWPTQTQDLINPKYSHPLLTHPLPPMVLREWGDEITHSDLPIPTEAELSGAFEEPEPKPDAKDKDDSGDDFASAGKAATNPGIAGGYGGRGGEMYGGRGGGGYGGGYGGGRGGGGYGGGRGGGGYGGGRGGGGYGGGYGGRGGASGEAELPEFTWDERTPYVLFRYFDDTVEPGHRYRYRVRLALADVNGANVPAKYLDQSVSARKAANVKDGKPLPYRFTNWSKPSTVASVPHTGLAYIVGAKPSLPANLASEGTAQLVVKALDSKLPAEAAVGGPFARGAVLNFIGKKAEILWSSAFEAEDREGEPKTAPTFDFLTGMTVLDFAGGDPLNNSRDLKAPAAVLFMDETGQMMIKNELEDQKPVKEYSGVLEAKREQDRDQNDRDSGRGGGGYGGGGGRGGRGGR